MGLERLAAEIEAKAKAELDAELARRSQEEAKLLASRAERLKAIDDASQRILEVESRREKVQRLARAKVEARKLLYEARERRIGTGLKSARDALADYTKSSDYPKLLEKMVEHATEVLGPKVKLLARSADLPTLKSVAGRGVPASAAPMIGGLIAETPDGKRRLDLSFDDLLRLKEDRVREILSR